LNSRAGAEKNRNPAFTKSYLLLNKVNTYVRCLTIIGPDGLLHADYATDLGHLVTESVLWPPNRFQFRLGTGWNWKTHVIPLLYWFWKFPGPFAVIPWLEGPVFYSEIQAPETSKRRHLQLPQHAQSSLFFQARDFLWKTGVAESAERSSWCGSACAAVQATQRRSIFNPVVRGQLALRGREKTNSTQSSPRLSDSLHLNCVFGKGLTHPPFFKVTGRTAWLGRPKPSNRIL